MKKSVVYFMVVVMFLSIILIGCSGNKAMSLLNEANENFKNLQSYVKVEYDVHRINEEYVETQINFTQFISEGEHINPNKNKHFVLGYPKIISDGNGIKNNKPTLIIERYPLEDTKAKVNEYISPEGDEFGYILYKDYEVTTDNVKINKNDMFHLLNSVVSGKEQNVAITTYTMGLFNLNVFPEKIMDLTIKETNDEYYILQGSVKGSNDEMFLIYEEADIEIWIHKDSKLIAKEIYQNKNGTNEDFIVFEYINYNQEEISDEFFKEKTVEEKIEFYKNLFK